MQLAVSVVDAPLLIVEGEADSVQVGGWVTVTVAEATAPEPAAFVPMTVYVASAVGETLPLDADDPSPPLPLHVYEVAAGVQLAVSVVDPPRLIVEGDGVKVQVGGWFTVTVADATVLLPEALVPITVYVASVEGETLPLDAEDPNPLLLLQV